MIANGADIRRLSSNYDMTAVTALPNLDLALGKYFLHLNILEERTVSLFVMLLDLTDCTELSCEFRESFSLSCLGEILIHVCPLIVLTVSSSLEVICSRTDAVQLLEPHLCMLFLIVSSLKEDSSDLLISFLLCLRSEICILVASLGLSCKCSLEILLRLCSRILISHCLYLLETVLLMANGALVGSLVAFMNITADLTYISHNDTSDDLCVGSTDPM